MEGFGQRMWSCAEPRLHVGKTPWIESLSYDEVMHASSLARTAEAGRLSTGDGVGEALEEEKVAGGLPGLWYGVYLAVRTWSMTK